MEGARGGPSPFERWAGVSQGVFGAAQAVGHVPVTTSTGDRNWHGVRGTAEVPRPGAALPPRRSGLHFPSPGRKPPPSTSRSDSKIVTIGDQSHAVVRDPLRAGAGARSYMEQGAAQGGREPRGTQGARPLLRPPPESRKCTHLRASRQCRWLQVNGLTLVPASARPQRTSESRMCLLFVSTHPPCQ